MYVFTHNTLEDPSKIYGSLRSGIDIRNFIYMYIYIHWHIEGAVAEFKAKWYTVYRETFAPVLFLPFHPSCQRVNYSNVQFSLCFWSNSRRGEIVCK